MTVSIKNNTAGNKGFGLILDIIIVAIIALAAVAGYFAFVKKSAMVAPQPPIIQTVKPTATQTSNNQLNPTPQDETANWKTYRNERLGIQFEYPKSWSLKLDFDENLSLQENIRKASNNGIITNYKTDSFPIKYGRYQVPDDYFTIGFNIKDISSKAIVEKNLLADSKCQSVKDAVIGSKQVKLITSLPCDPEGPGTAIIWFNQSNIVLLTLGQKNTVEQQKEALTHVINSFTFLTVKEKP